MTRMIMLVVLIGLGLLVAGHPGDDAADAAKRRLRNVTKSATALQAGDGAVIANGAFISNEPFAFANVGTIRRITGVTIAPIIHDGDTGPGEGDENELTLVLDGIDTGIKLNGFLDNQSSYPTISGVPSNQGQILAALKADGKLEATIRDAVPADTNTITVPAYYIEMTIKGKQKS